MTQNRVFWSKGLPNRVLLRRPDRTAPRVRETPVTQVWHSSGSPGPWSLSTYPEPPSARVPTQAWNDRAPRAGTAAPPDGRPHPPPRGPRWREDGRSRTRSRAAPRGSVRRGGQRGPPGAEVKRQLRRACGACEEAEKGLRGCRGTGVGQAEESQRRPPWGLTRQGLGDDGTRRGRHALADDGDTRKTWGREEERSPSSQPPGSGSRRPL